MMSSPLCRDTRYTLHYWRPGASGDLPERVALHLDDCPNCLHLFATTYVPVRLMRRVRRERGFAEASMLLAAAALLLFPITWQPHFSLPEDGVSIQESEDEACAMMPEDDLCDPFEEEVSDAA